jgi:hypothetical protein
MAGEDCGRSHPGPQPSVATSNAHAVQQQHSQPPPRNTSPPYWSYLPQAHPAHLQQQQQQQSQPSHHPHPQVAVPNARKGMTQTVAPPSRVEKGAAASNGRGGGRPAPIPPPSSILQWYYPAPPSLHLLSLLAGLRSSPSLQLTWPFDTIGCRTISGSQGQGAPQPHVFSLLRLLHARVHQDRERCQLWYPTSARRPLSLSPALALWFILGFKSPFTTLVLPVSHPAHRRQMDPFGVPRSQDETFGHPWQQQVPSLRHPHQDHFPAQECRGAARFRVQQQIASAKHTHGEFGPAASVSSPRAE